MILGDCTVTKEGKRRSNIEIGKKFWDRIPAK